MRKSEIEIITPSDWRKFGKIVVWVGGFVGAILSICVGIGTLNSCADKHILIVVEPKLSPIADMVQFNLEANGQWDAYLKYRAKKVADNKIKRGDDSQLNP